MTPLTALVSTAALGIGANTENLPIGLAYGLRGREIGLFRNLVIAAVTTAATALPQIAGQGLHGYLPTKLPDVAAGLLLMGLGLFNIWIERRRPEGRLNLPSRRQGTAKRPDFLETLTLAGAMSINNIGLGFAGGIAGLGVGPVAISVAGFSVLLLWLGEWLSRAVALPIATRVGWLQLDGNLLIVAAGVLMLVGL
jgi:putative Mn2+ efflux pump MntP